METKTNENQNKEKTLNSKISTSNQTKTFNKIKDNFQNDKIINKNENNTVFYEFLELLFNDFQFF